MSSVDAKKAWLEQYIDRELDQDQRATLMHLAGDDFVLIFRSAQNGGRLKRVTRRTIGRPRASIPTGPLSTPADTQTPTPSNQLPSAAKAPTPSNQRPPAAEAQTPVPTGPVNARPQVAPPGSMWQPLEKGGFVIGNPGAGQAFVVPLNELIWQALSNEGEPIDTPTDMADAARQAERWLFERMIERVQVLRFARQQEPADGFQRLTDSEQERLDRIEECLDQFSRSIAERPSNVRKLKQG